MSFNCGTRTNTNTKDTATTGDWLDEINIPVTTALRRPVAVDYRDCYRDWLEDGFVCIRHGKMRDW